MYFWLSLLSVYTGLVLFSALVVALPPRILPGSRIQPDNLYALPPPLPKEILAVISGPTTLKKTAPQSSNSVQSSVHHTAPNSSTGPRIVNPPMKMYSKVEYSNYDYHTDSHNVQCFNTPRPDASCCNDVGCAADSGPRDVNLRCRQLDSKKFGQSVHQQFCIREGYP
ncbi:hypothetical protein VKT23_009024 [Stygiomarasmius scandens]|uniref:Secreted protein n=1 Tax=Marasmiellus scandens TaxID=2682957 RepID=A0ABR1JKV4_9AGAR